MLAQGPSSINERITSHPRTGVLLFAPLGCDGLSSDDAASKRRSQDRARAFRSIQLPASQ
jgi:hypothetical protein